MSTKTNTATARGTYRILVGRDFFGQDFNIHFIFFSETFVSVNGKAVGVPSGAKDWHHACNAAKARKEWADYIKKGFKRDTNLEAFYNAK